VQATSRQHTDNKRRQQAGVVASGVLTTAQIAEAVGVSGQTIRRWAQLGLLPAPVKSHRGRRGTVAEWPDEAREIALWVYGELESGRTIRELRDAGRRGGGVR